MNPCCVTLWLFLLNSGHAFACGLYPFSFIQATVFTTSLIYHGGLIGGFRPFDIAAVYIKVGFIFHVLTHQGGLISSVLYAAAALLYFYTKIADDDRAHFCVHIITAAGNYYLIQHTCQDSP